MQRDRASLKQGNQAPNETVPSQTAQTTSGWSWSSLTSSLPSISSLFGSSAVPSEASQPLLNPTSEDAPSRVDSTLSSERKSDANHPEEEDTEDEDYVSLIPEEKKGASKEKDESWNLVHLVPDIGGSKGLDLEGRIVDIEGLDPLGRIVEVVDPQLAIPKKDRVYRTDQNPDNNPIQLVEKFLVLKNQAIDAEGNPIPETGTLELSDKPFGSQYDKELEEDFTQILSLYTTESPEIITHVVHKTEVKTFQNSTDTRVDLSPEKMRKLSEEERKEVMSSAEKNSLENPLDRKESKTDISQIIKHEALDHESKTLTPLSQNQQPLDSDKSNDFCVIAWCSDYLMVSPGIRVEQGQGTLPEFKADQLLPPASDPNTFAGTWLDRTGLTSPDDDLNYFTYKVINTGGEIIITLAAGSISFTFALAAAAAGGGYSLSDISLTDFDKTVEFISKLSVEQQIEAAVAFFGSYFANLRHNIGFLRNTLPQILKKLGSLLHLQENPAGTLVAFIAAALAAVGAGQVGRDSGKDELVKWWNGVATGTAILLGRWLGTEALAERVGAWWRSPNKSWKDIFNLSAVVSLPGSLMILLAYGHKFGKAMDCFSHGGYYGLSPWITTPLSLVFGGSLTGIMYEDRSSHLPTALQIGYRKRFQPRAYFGQEIAQAACSRSSNVTTFLLRHFSDEEDTKDQTALASQEKQPFTSPVEVYPSRWNKFVFIADGICALISGFAGKGVMDNSIEDTNFVVNGIIKKGSEEAVGAGWVAGFGGVAPLNWAVTLRTYHSAEIVTLVDAHKVYQPHIAEGCAVFFDVVAQKGPEKPLQNFTPEDLKRVEKPVPFSHLDLISKLIPKDFHRHPHRFQPIASQPLSNPPQTHPLSLTDDQKDRSSRSLTFLSQS